jgi:CRP-like cAMP-binding protein
LSTASIYLSLTGEPKSTEVTSWWPVLFSFWAVFALGRSFLAITQNGLMHFAKGTGVQLNVSIDAVSFALSSDSFSTVRATGALLAAGAFLPLSPLLPAGLAAWFGGIPGAGVFSGLLFFSVSSPFVHSVATEWLRSYYSYYLQSKRTNIDLSVERETHAIHLAAGVVWTFSFLIFIGFFYFPFIKGIALGLEWRSMSTLASAGLFFLIQLVVLFSLVADVLARRGNKLGALQVRTLWRRRYSEALAADAVRERRKPTQSELQDLPLLRTVPLYIGQRIIENSQVADVETGVAVCRQGNRDRILFVVLTGSFAVTRLSGSRSGTGPIRKKVVAVLEAGAVFGESAFFFDHPRSADVVALENSTVLAIRHDESMKTLSDKHSDELQLRIWFFQVLAANPDWRQLPSEALDALVRAGTGATFSAGEKVIREGEEGQDCYFIVQGNATVVQNLKPINNMKAGDVIGEIALLWPGTLRTATVIADTDLLTVRLNSDRLWRLLESHLPLAVEIEKIGEARIAADQLRKKP